jgi:hypothetical protein
MKEVSMIEGKENMAGFLYRQKERIEARSRFKELVNLVKRTKQFWFEIKGTILYYYLKHDADIAHG